jgi:anaerobic dimethyl sulfoxide reductase subunit C (anchor subunit)
MNIREWTLPVYTLLTQLSVGSLFVLWVIRSWSNLKAGEDKIDRYIKIPILILLATIVFAMVFAHLHLSKPWLSFLALRNIKTSWLSRELLSNIFYAIFVGLLLLSLWYHEKRKKTITILGWVAILLGFTTDYCMSRIYLLPSQPAWNSILTPVSFLVTTILLGIVTVPMLFLMDLIFKRTPALEDQTEHAQLIEPSLIRFAFVAVILSILIVGINLLQITSLFSGSATAQTSLDLLRNIYQPLLIIRLVLLFVGSGWLVFVSVQLSRRKLLVGNLLPKVFITCLLVMIAEILGRFLFYAIHVRIGI